MSRLSAQADMEYLPSYGPTIAGLTQLFDNIGQLRDLAPIRLIDPCAGEGDALRTLADSIRTEYEGRTGRRIAKKSNRDLRGRVGHRARAQGAQETQARVVQTDYFNTLITPEAFNLMLLNPPYDFDPDYKRLEQRFLVQGDPASGSGRRSDLHGSSLRAEHRRQVSGAQLLQLPRLAGGRQSGCRALQPGDAGGRPQHQPCEPDREQAEPGALCAG